MKRIITITLGLFIVFGSLAQETKTQLQTRIDVIRNETVAGANTKTRLANAYQELSDGSIGVYPVVTTGTNTYAGTLIGLDAYSGRIVFVTFPNNNSGASTLNINTIGAGNIQKYDGGWTALEADDIVAGQLYRVYHDGTRWQIDLGGSGGAGLVDADYGDITVSGTGTAMTIDNLAVTNAKINDVAVGKVTGLGTGVATALAINVGSAGAPVVNGGALGTPSSGTLTSATGLPISTGVSGLGTGVATFLATPSSANLASAVTDETGTGALVLAVSPALTSTPTAPTASFGTNTTQIATTAFVIANSGVITQVSTSTSGGTITLDMNSLIQRMHVGSATFAAAKIIAISNTTNSLLFQFTFTITNVAAVLTMPSNFLLSDVNWNGTDWTPPATGQYEMGGSYDGTNWIVKIAGPFN